MTALFSILALISSLGADQAEEDEDLDWVTGHRLDEIRDLFRRREARVWVWWDAYVAKHNPVLPEGIRMVERPMPAELKPPKGEPPLRLPPGWVWSTGRSLIDDVRPVRSLFVQFTFTRPHEEGTASAEHHARGFSQMLEPFLQHDRTRFPNDAIRLVIRQEWPMRSGLLYRKGPLLFDAERPEHLQWLIQALTETLTPSTAKVPMDLGPLVHAKTTQEAVQAFSTLAEKQATDLFLSELFARHWEDSSSSERRRDMARFTRELHRWAGNRLGEYIMANELGEPVPDPRDGPIAFYFQER